jgi:coenzyme F420-reducing hydrogenase gamma subunit
MGPVTQTGCGAICPAYARGCYGCFGPMESPNTVSLSEFWKKMGVDEAEMLRAYRTYNAYSEAFRRESESHE